MRVELAFLVAASSEFSIRRNRSVCFCHPRNGDFETISGKEDLIVKSSANETKVFPAEQLRAATSVLQSQLQRSHHIGDMRLYPL